MSRLLALGSDLTKPTISITAPGSGATVSGTITISATAADNYAVVGVQFKMDGVNIGAEDTSPPFSVTYDTHLLANGGHTITAVARDAAGNTQTATLNFTVGNGIAGGSLYFGNYAIWDDGANDGAGGYVGGRVPGPGYDQRWDFNFIWEGTGDKNARPLPGNPDPTHYQMQVQYGTAGDGRMEGGSDGNVVHLIMAVGGFGEYNVWDNGPAWGPFRNGPVINVNGGENVAFTRYDNSPGWNTCIFQGTRCFYDFVPKAGYLS